MRSLGINLGAPSPPPSFCGVRRLALDPMADDSHNIAKAVAESLREADGGAAALLTGQEGNNPLRRMLKLTKKQKKAKKAKKAKAKAKAKAATSVDVTAVTDGKPKQPNCAWQAYGACVCVCVCFFLRGCGSARRDVVEAEESHVLINFFLFNTQTIHKQYTNNTQTIHKQYTNKNLVTVSCFLCVGLRVGGAVCIYHFFGERCFDLLVDPADPVHSIPNRLIKTTQIHKTIPGE
jgi:hypothetical protein